MAAATYYVTRMAAVGSLALLTACANMSPQGQHTAVGAGAGAALGAGLGALIGDSSQAALIGAGIGSVVGGVVGYNWKGIKQDVEKSGASDLGVAVIEMPDGTLKVNIPSNVSFDTNKSVLKPALLPVLDSVARALNQHPELRAKAIGYTDTTGSDAINMPLSQRRAGAVTQYLAGQGVAPGRLTAEGRGSASPVGDNNTPEGRALNRRVELFLYAVK
ncbi:OmpA family protein [uncultured Castellaniella sp.]|uniref:OmpA family protein n=1 Tax=uncultured Castellaniella sp. TaxID=647907 RepID=UPI002631C4FA|nr:OmpA family protein [uncultured Castellaniella sp.]